MSVLSSTLFEKYEQILSCRFVQIYDKQKDGCKMAFLHGFFVEIDLINTKKYVTLAKKAAGAL